MPHWTDSVTDREALAGGTAAFVDDTTVRAVVEADIGVTGGTWVR